jgi:hypothetical protein
MADKPEVTVKLTKVEALALVNAAETGLRVIEALGLVKNTATMEEAVRKLRRATVVSQFESGSSSEKVIPAAVQRSLGVSNDVERAS